jgi:MFS family permease
MSRTVTSRVTPVLRELAAGARTWARRCPLTATYLLLLVAVAVLLALLPNELADKVVYHASTSLQGLRDKPLFVLVASAFVLWGGLAGLLLLPLVAVVMGAVERWLGKLATVLVFAFGHVGATLGLAVILVSGISHRAIDPQIATVHREPTDVGHVLAAFIGLVLAVVLLRAVAFASAAQSDSLSEAE